MSSDSTDTADTADEHSESGDNNANSLSPQRDAAGLSGDDERRSRQKMAAGDQPDTDALGHQDGAS